MVAPDELNPAHAAPDSVTFTVTVNIHCPNGTKFSVQTSLSSTIREFKAVVAENCDVTAEQQRLIYKGRILKDEETLESYGLQSDHTVHMVKGFATSASLAGADANARNATTPPASAQNTLLESEVSDNAGLALGGLGSFQPTADVVLNCKPSTGRTGSSSSSCYARDRKQSADP